MTSPYFGLALRRWLHGFSESTTADLTDGQLLQRFRHDRNDAAFETLVRRHGPLVLGVCRRLLRDSHDADDAFQATFLVLACRAASIRRTESVASFLYGTASRIARRLRGQKARRRTLERQAAALQPEASSLLSEEHELHALLHEELNRLPRKYRDVLILCYLQSKTHEQAARELGYPPGSMSRHLERARQLLRERLLARGGGMLAALAGATLAESASAAVSPALLYGTLDTIRRHALASALLAGSSPPVAVMLAQGILRAAALTRWTLAAVLLTAGVVAGGVTALQTSAPRPLPAEAKAAPLEREQPRRDLHGDPLPPAALARLGTVRQRAPDSHLAVTVDGKEIVAVSSDLTLRRFDAQTGALRAVRQLPKASTFGWSNLLSPRGTFALAVGISGPGKYHLDLWDLEQGKIRQTLPLSEYFPRGATAFSADERRVAVADSSGDHQRHRVLVWDLQTSKSRVLWSETRDVRQFSLEPVVILSPDRKRLVACHFDQILRCWEVESGKLLWQSAQKIWSALIVFSADGRTVVTPSGIGTNGIDIRDAATGKLLESKRTPKEALCLLGFSPDGRFLAFQTGKEEVVMWEPGKEKVTFRFPRPLYRRDDSTLFIANRIPTNFVFTPDGKGFIRRAGALQRWDLTTGKPVYMDTENWGHTEEVTRLLFSPDGRLLASLAKDQTARLWEIATARTLHVISKGLSDHLAFTRDGRNLLTPAFGLDKTVLQATDVATGRPGRGFALTDRREVLYGSREKELRVTADGKKVLMLTGKNGGNSEESILTVWNAATGECLVHKRVPWSEDSLLTPDGQSVLTPNSATGAVRLLSLETSESRWQLNAERTPDPQQRFYAGRCDLVLSPNGRLMAAHNCFLHLITFQTEYDGIRVADMATGRQLHKLSIEEPAVFAFSADHRLFAVASSVRIRLWETATWQEVGSLRLAADQNRPADRASVRSLAFAPDGRLLATGHADGTILLWDTTLRSGARGAPLGSAERETLWTYLVGTDAAKAYAAVWRLTDDPEASVAFLKERLKPVPPVPVKVLHALLDDLDSDRFAVREVAERKLRVFGERMASALRTELKAKPTLEKRKRMEKLLAEMDVADPLSGEPLRAVRAVQVLERVGSAEALKFLEELSEGVESARLTQVANEALMRLRKR